MIAAGAGGSRQSWFGMDLGFRTVSPVWSHRWLWNFRITLEGYRGGSLLFLKVIRQISRSQGAKKTPIWHRFERFPTITSVWIHRWLWNFTASLKVCTGGFLLFLKVIHQISRSHRAKHIIWPRFRVNLGGRSYQIPQICLVLWNIINRIGENMYITVM